MILGNVVSCISLNWHLTSEGLDDSSTVFLFHLKSRILVFFNFLILADAYVWNNFSVLILLSLLKIVASVSLVGLLAEYLCVCCLVGIYQIKINRAIAGHVIAPDQLLPVALARGSSGLQLDFTYHSRATPAMVRRRRLCRVVSVICVAELPCSSLCSYV